MQFIYGIACSVGVMSS